MIAPGAWARIRNTAECGKRKRLRAGSVKLLSASQKPVDLTVVAAALIIIAPTGTPGAERLTHA
jgi:hypothetical protein